MGRSAACSAVALGLGELGGELDERGSARRHHALEHVVTCGEQGHEPRAPVARALLAGDVAALHEPVDRARHRRQRHREVARDVLDRAAASCSERRNSAFICVKESPSSPSTRNMSGDAVRLTWAERTASWSASCCGVATVACTHASKADQGGSHRVAIVRQVTAAPVPEEAEALDAYSRVVTYVAETVSPSVANLRVGRGARRGRRLRRRDHARTDSCSPPRTSSRARGGRVRASFTDGRELALRLVGTDPLSDLAVLRADDRRAAAGAAGRRRRAAGRPARGRDRQPARLRELGHGGRRLRAGPLAADARGRDGARDRRRDPDRRGAEPGQLGRRAGRRRAAASSASTPRSPASGSAWRCRSTRRRARSSRR